MIIAFLISTYQYCISPCYDTYDHDNHEKNLTDLY